MRCVYILKFGKISVKLFSLGVQYPYHCTDGMKCAMEEWTHSSMPNFIPIDATCRPFGQKTS